MVHTWEARVVDAGIASAWQGWRRRVADHLEAAIAEERCEELTFTAPTGESLTVEVDDIGILVIAGDQVTTTEYVDEAAYAVFRTLHDDWQVVHPAFVDSDLEPRVAIPDNPVGSARLPVPVLGRAVSREQLQAWVEATFQETLSVKLRVMSNGDIAWRGRRGESILVSVRNDSRIEIWTVLARHVGRKKARKQVERLSRENFGLKFFLRQDELRMARSFIASPFVPDHLHTALRDFTASSKQFGWVEDRVQRDKVKRERSDLGAVEAKVTALEAQLDAARRAQAEAEAELASLKWSVIETVGHLPDPTLDGL